MYQVVFFSNFAGKDVNQLTEKSMGKGDKKTRRGKIVIGSYGVRRPHRIKKAASIADKATKTKPKKVLEQKSRKVTEEPIVMVEPLITNEQIIVNEPIAAPSVQVEIPLDIKPPKTPVKKAATKKTPVKAEKTEKAESGEVKPKAVRTRKKAAEPIEEKEKSTKE